MKKFKKVMILATVLAAVAAFAGCVDNKQSQTISKIIQDKQQGSSVSEIKDSEIPKEVESQRGFKNYYMVTNEENDAKEFCLTLFSDGTFGFTYNKLNSYYATGTYEVKEGKLIARTEDGKYHYVFKIDGDRKYVFTKGESSEVPVIDKKTIEDGAVFKLDGETMRGVIKSMVNNTILLSSREDDCPGVYDVSVHAGIDLTKIQEGDDVIITWDGTILEIDPPQIKANSIEVIK